MQTIGKCKYPHWTCKNADLSQSMGPRKFFLFGDIMTVNKNIVLIVNGGPEAGKDVFTSQIKFHFAADMYNNRLYNYMSTVDHIKEIALEKFDWDGIKDEKGRRLLSDLKAASTRYNIGPFKKIINHIDNLKNFSIDYVYIIISIIHCREPEEIQRLKHYYKNECITILIKRNTNIVISNQSDNDVDKYLYEYIIDNNGSLDDFYDRCKDFYDSLKI
jgi:hypothetical protein